MSLWGISRALFKIKLEPPISLWGMHALYTNKTGCNNIALGQYALIGNTTGCSNVALGYQALYTNTTGDNNVALGYQAMAAIGATSGSNNVATRFEAFKHNTSGNNNIALGAGALALGNTDCAIVLNNSPLPSFPVSGAHPNAFYVASIQGIGVTGGMWYNTSTKEILYSKLPSLLSFLTRNMKGKCFAMLALRRLPGGPIYMSINLRRPNSTKLPKSPYHPTSNISMGAHGCM